MAITTGIIVLSMKSIAIYKNYLAKTQLALIANRVATDIVNLQEISLFGGDRLQYYLDVEKSGYVMRSNRAVIKRVGFAAMGCADIYFSWCSITIGFNSSGRPKSSHTLTLMHKNLSDLYYTIAVEPVTGRVVVNEKK